jgi:ribonuclease P protein component
VPERTGFVRACKLAADAVLFVHVVQKEERVSRHKVEAGVCESFPRRLRLTRAKEFQQVFKNNFRSGDAFITILVGKNEGSCPRLGFAIARKQVPTAVKRNALKRLFRESFRIGQHRLPKRDMVIMVRREIILKKPAKLRTLLDQHWNSIIKQCENS